MCGTGTIEKMMQMNLTCILMQYWSRILRHHTSCGLYGTVPRGKLTVRIGLSQHVTAGILSLTRESS